MPWMAFSASKRNCRTSCLPIPSKPNRLPCNASSSWMRAQQRRFNNRPSDWRRRCSTASNAFRPSYSISAVVYGETDVRGHQPLPGMAVARVKRLPSGPVWIVLYWPVTVLNDSAGFTTTPQIVAQTTTAALSCMRWMPIGMCFWLRCSWRGCRVQDLDQGRSLQSRSGRQYLQRTGWQSVGRNPGNPGSRPEDCRNRSAWCLVTGASRQRR